MIFLREPNLLRYLDQSVTIAFDSFGVRIGVTCEDPAVADRLSAHLPPGAQRISDGVEIGFELVTQQGWPHSPPMVRLTQEKDVLLESMDIDEVLEVLENSIEMAVALNTREYIFVHAGVVEWLGRAVLLPGRSFTGKSTLVSALAQAGATYYSDEFAVLDSRGYVHPFARYLTARGQARMRFSRVGVDPIPIGLVAVAPYREGAIWQPDRLSRGRAVLALLDNTIVARTQPERALDVLSRGIEGSLAVAHERGDADDTAGRLLSWLHEAWSSGNLRDSK